MDDSATLEKAYQTGDPSLKWVVLTLECNVTTCGLYCRISSGRQRYMVQFGPMLQVNHM